MHAVKNSREEIIRRGAEIIHLKGYHATGLQEILESAGVPKGSFYFYFRSKEDFGIEIIDFFSSLIEGFFARFLNDATEPPLGRVAKLMDFYSSLFKKQGYSLGCPIGNLSLEMSDTNERFRKRLNDSVTRLIRLLESCLEEAKRDESVPAELDTAEAARFIFYGFEGAVLHTKVLIDPAPIKTFRACVQRYLAKNIHATNEPEKGTRTRR